jgi:hypothetical protein
VEVDALNRPANLLAVASASLALLAPLTASACPYCAANNQSGVGGTIALGALILLPFAVVATVLKLLRSEGRHHA